MATLFVDAEEQSQRLQLDDTFRPPIEGPIRLGRDHYDYYEEFSPFPGMIDEMRLIPEVLSAKQVRDLYSQVRTRPAVEG
ncbi:MAG: hypothetical protein R3E12_13390 [Candidatus Eisenbacteria bacterium]